MEIYFEQLLVCPAKGDTRDIKVLLDRFKPGTDHLLQSLLGASLPKHTDK